MYTSPTHGRAHFCVWSYTFPCVEAPRALHISHGVPTAMQRVANVQGVGATSGWIGTLGRNSSWKLSWEFDLFV